MGNLKIAAKDIANIFIGGTPAAAVYQNGKKIWPLDHMPNPDAWWRAEDVIANDGDRVKLLTDFSGNGNDLKPQGSALGAQYEANNGGKPALFIGAESNYTMSSPSLNASVNTRTMFAIVTMRNSTGNHNLIDGSANGGLSLRQTGSNYQIVVRAIKAGPSSTGNNLIAGQRTLVSMRWNGTTVDYWADGNPAGSAAYDTPVTTGTYQIVGGGTSYMDGRLFEMMIYNRVLTDAQVERVNSYLKQKYNI